MSRPKVFLSIDFDHWVREDPALDLGHADNAMNLLPIWQARAMGWLHQGADPERVVPLADESVSHKEVRRFFEQHLGWVFDDSFTVVVESHRWAHAALRWQSKRLGQPVDVVNIDAHHDVSYDAREDAVPRKLSCDCWIGHAMRSGYTKSVTQVYPSWRDGYEGGQENPRQPRRVAARYGVAYRSLSCIEDLVDCGPVKYGCEVVGVVVARSGPWTPPWLDKEFVACVEQFRDRIIPASFDPAKWIRPLDLQAMRTLYRKEASDAVPTR